MESDEFIELFIEQFLGVLDELVSSEEGGEEPDEQELVLLDLDDDVEPEDDEDEDEICEDDDDVDMTLIDSICSLIILFCCSIQHSMQNFLFFSFVCLFQINSIFNQIKIVIFVINKFIDIYFILIFFLL